MHRAGVLRRPGSSRWGKRCFTMHMFIILGMVHVAGRVSAKLLLAFRATETVCLAFVAFSELAAWLDGHAAHRIVLTSMLVFLMLGMFMVEMALGGVHWAYFLLSSLGVSVSLRWECPPWLWPNMCISGHSSRIK